MNQEFFMTGFVKRAEEKGINKKQAIELAKQAGILGTLGRAAWDMTGAPVVSAVGDAGNMLSRGAHGDFRGALNAGGSLLGHGALAALNFIPGAGLGGMAAKGGLRLAEGGLARLGADGLANMAGRFGGRFAGMQAAAGGAARSGMNSMLGTAGRGVQNMAGRIGQAGVNNFRPGSALGNAAEGAGNMMNRFGASMKNSGIIGNIEQRAGYGLRPGMQRAVNSAAYTAPASYAYNQYQQRQENPEGDPNDYIDYSGY